MSATQNDMVAMYRNMVLGRLLEKELSKIVDGWHALVGEEAVVVGSFYNLRKEDCISAHFRGASLAYYLKGGSLRRIIASHLGKETSYTSGRSYGKSGPFEINAFGKFAGSLGTNLNMITGTALASKMRKESNVSIVTFGDGTSNRGDFHEAINLSSVLKLPVIFICQNNQFGSTLRFSKAMGCKSVADRAAGYGIPGIEVDGNDVIAVYEVVQNAIKRARKGEGPSLIDAKTYRMGGMSVNDPQELLDMYRPPQEVEMWQKKDPIDRLQNKLLASNVLKEENCLEIYKLASKEVADASELAQLDPYPSDKYLKMGGVLSGNNDGENA